MKITVLRSAKRTMANGIRFYEGHAAGLGSYFLNSIMADIRSLKIYAGVHQKFGNFYRMVCSRFPYSIYYKKTGSDVTIYGILDDRRDPEWIRNTLSGLGVEE